MELLLLPLQGMGAIFILAPWAAFLPAGAFAWAWVRRRRLLLMAAAIGWTTYGFYELGMKLRILCSGECNIRIDLLAIYPLLIAISLLAIMATRRRRQG